MEMEGHRGKLNPMGLTIHYSFDSAERDAASARRLVTRLQRRATELPFKSVDEVIELTANPDDPVDLSDDPRLGWLLIQATRFLLDGNEVAAEVDPTHVIAFSTLPGPGSEPASFGLCRYPATAIGRDGNTIDTGLATGWHWQSFCKTQYASNPTHGGTDHFVRCHTAIISVLDEARSLGILSDVTDEGGYWERRDPVALGQEVERWNGLIAGFTGALKDQLGNVGMKSEITKFPNFEHLEAKERLTGDEGEP